VGEDGGLRAVGQSEFGEHPGHVGLIVASLMNRFCAASAFARPRPMRVSTSRSRSESRASLRRDSVRCGWSRGATYSTISRRVTAGENISEPAATPRMSATAGGHRPDVGDRRAGRRPGHPAGVEELLAQRHPDADPRADHEQNPDPADDLVPITGLFTGVCLPPVVCKSVVRRGCGV